MWLFSWPAENWGCGAFALSGVFGVTRAALKSHGDNSYLRSTLRRQHRGVLWVPLG